MGVAQTVITGLELPAQREIVRQVARLQQAIQLRDIEGIAIAHEVRQHTGIQRQAITEIDFTRNQLRELHRL